MRIAGFLKHSSVNGDGIRAVVFFQGCKHGCKGCQNPDTWNFEGGTEVTIDDVMTAIHSAKFITGVTLSGGDPLYQAGDALIIAKKCRELGLNVWVYTGFTYEEILDGQAGKEAIELLDNVDVLVDGMFEIDKLTTELPYRGSSNQRLLRLSQKEKGINNND